MASFQRRTKRDVEEMRSRSVAKAHGAFTRLIRSDDFRIGGFPCDFGRHHRTCKTQYADIGRGAGWSKCEGESYGVGCAGRLLDIVAVRPAMFLNANAKRLRSGRSPCSGPVATKDAMIHFLT
jgi:hypothetical protein